MKKPIKEEIEIETVPWGEQGRVDPFGGASIAVVPSMPETSEKGGRQRYRGTRETGHIMVKKISSS